MNELRSLYADRPHKNRKLEIHEIESLRTIVIELIPITNLGHETLIATRLGEFSTPIQFPNCLCLCLHQQSEAKREKEKKT